MFPLFAEWQSLHLACSAATAVHSFSDAGGGLPISLYPACLQHHLQGRRPRAWQQGSLGRGCAMGLRSEKAVALPIRVQWVSFGTRTSPSGLPPSRGEAVDSSLASGVSEEMHSAFPNVPDFGSGLRWLAPSSVRGCRFQLSQRFFFLSGQSSAHKILRHRGLLPCEGRGCRFQLSRSGCPRNCFCVFSSFSVKKQ